MEAENFIYMLIAVSFVLIQLLHQIWGYIRERKFYIYDKGEIVESRALTRDEMGTVDGANTICKIRYIYNGESYFQTLTTTRLKIPKESEKIDIVFNTKSMTIGDAYSFSSILIIFTVFLFLIFLSLYEI